MSVASYVFSSVAWEMLEVADRLLCLYRRFELFDLIQAESTTYKTLTDECTTWALSQVRSTGYNVLLVHCQQILSRNEYKSSNENGRK